MYHLTRQSAAKLSFVMLIRFERHFIVICQIVVMMMIMVLVAASDSGGDDDDDDDDKDDDNTDLNKILDKIGAWNPEMGV